MGNWSTVMAAARVAIGWVTALPASTQLVPVSNESNGPDDTGHGTVAYHYEIGKFEVTAGEYTEFLNAVARVDTYGLYKTFMAEGWLADGYSAPAIQRTTGPEGLIYSVATDWANRPVNYVSWADAARFANWLTNGQPTGGQDLSTTEDGSYYLNGATTDAQLMAVTRKPGARYVIPTDDEWYKAAYHKNDGKTDNYWDFPTATDATPSTQLLSPDPGNNTNYFYAVGAPHYRTEVGEFENSESPYGTFDQGGNVFEWTESVYVDACRGNRGGAYFSYEGPNGSIGNMRSSGYGYSTPTRLESFIGFRVALVPEPVTFPMVLLALGILSLLVLPRKTDPIKMREGC